MSRTVPLLSRFEDPGSSSDPRIRALVQHLSELDYAPAPRPEFRSELRAQLVAIAGRVIDEAQRAPENETAGPATLDPVEAAQAARTASVTELKPPAARQRRSVGRTVGRPLGLAAACCAVLALGLGGAVWKSRSALPGDSLYGLKRTSENVQLSLTHGRTARGHEYLKLATTRVQEAQDLLGQTSAMASGSGVQAGGLSPQTVSLIRSTLGSANTDVKSGSSLLGTQAVQSSSTRPLSIMTNWAPSQLKQLEHLATDLGSGPAQASTLNAWNLVKSAQTRARQLGPKVIAHCTAAHSDDLGPVHCSSAPKSHPTNPTTPEPGSTHASRHTSSRPSGPTTRGTHPATKGSTSPSGTATHRSKHPTRSGPSTTPAGSTSKPTTRPTELPTTVPTKLPTTLPTKLPTLLPTKLVPTLPVSVDSCGITVIGIHLGACPSGH